MPFSEFYQSFLESLDQVDVLAYGKEVSPPQPIDDSFMRITHIQKLDEGRLIYIANEKYPQRADCFSEKTAVLFRVKRILPMFFRFFSGKEEFPKTNLFQKACIALALIFYWRFIITWVDFGLKEIYMDRKYYCQPVREFYRVLTGRTKHIVCAILEHDDAYRFRMQDFFLVLNKTAFNQHPLKEFRRALNVIHSREINYDGGLGKLLVYKNLFLTYLFCNRKLLRELKEAVNQLNFYEIYPSIEDRYWMNKPANYNYFGLTNEQRAIINQTL